MFVGCRKPLLVLTMRAVSVDSGAFFADDYEETWEDVWEDNENDEDLKLGEDDFVTTKEEEMEEKPLFCGASLLLLIYICNAP